MPEYVNRILEQGAQLNDEATETLDAGTAARRRADEYIFITVVLATVLFLLVLSQRFRDVECPHRQARRLRPLMLYGLITIVTFPRL